MSTSRLNVEEIASWDHLMKFETMAATTTSPSSTVFYFRGQSRERWSLVPSLTRIAVSARLTAEQALSLEFALFKKFQAEAYRLLPPAMIPDTAARVNWLDWWTIMQHHGAPTRFLDWTTSLLVATYFAVAQGPDDDGAVWIFNIWPVVRQMEKLHPEASLHGPKNMGPDPLFRRPSAPPSLIYVYQPDRMTDRMAAQQTVFTMSALPLTDHHTVLDTVFSQRPGYYGKLRIRKDLKEEILIRLHRMNVTARSLFPGLDGLGRSMAELACLESYYHRKNQGLPREPTE